MLILFDQGTPLGLRAALSGHTIRTAREQGWSTLLNGDFLRAAEESGFNLLLTTDNNMPQQQRLHARKLAVVILSKNRWSLIRRRLKEIVQVVESAAPGTFTVVEIPDA